MSGRVIVSGGEQSFIGTIGTIESGGGGGSSGGTVVFGTVVVSTILSPFPVTVVAVATIGTVQFGNVTASISGGQLADVGTIGTILSGQVSATIESGVLQYVGTIGTILGQAAGGTVVFGTVVVSTILSPVAVQVLGGTIGTILSGAVTASISAGQLADVGTVGTLISGQVTASIVSGVMQYVGTVGTVLGGLVGVTATITSPVTALQAFLQSTLLANSAIITSASATLVCASLQDMVVDVWAGTVVAGSLLISVVGIEPSTNNQTSTLVAGNWFAGSLPTGQRLIALGPLGAKVAVLWTVPVSSSIQGVTISSEQSTTG